jgi:hypothetical protein
MIRSLVLAALACCLAINSNCQIFQNKSIALPAVELGDVHWVDLDGDKDLDLIYFGCQAWPLTCVTKIYENQDGSFVERPGELPNVRNGSITPGDYDNDGDKDILISGLDEQHEPISSLYKNNGGLSFSFELSFGQYFNTVAAWFDVDNDEDLDLLFAGGTLDPDVSLTFIFRNSGGTFQAIENTGMPRLEGSVEAADMNGDGRVDLLMTGIRETDGVSSKLFLNNGDGSFSVDQNWKMKDLYLGTIRAGDYDDDGDLDVAITGGVYIQPRIIPWIVLYENTGTSLRERVDLQLKGLIEGDVQWIDYDVDGDLDLLVAGRNDAMREPESFLYENTGNGNFSEMTNSGIPGFEHGSISSGDYDNDGDSDLAIIGSNNGATLTAIYDNQTITNSYNGNTSPLPPQSGFVSRSYRRQLSLKWNTGSDAETPAHTLNYNCYLQNTDGRILVPAVDFSSGFQRTINPPNAFTQKIVFNDLPEGEMVWAVQSIDGAFAGSTFSAENTFFQLNGPEVTQASIVTPSRIDLTWIDHSAIESTFKIYRSTSPIDEFEEIATLPANTSEYSDEYGFLTDTPYYYRVHAQSGEYSSYDSLTVVIPTAPSTLTAMSTNSTTILLAWADNSQHETGYTVERKSETDIEFEFVTTMPAKSSAFVDASLDEGATYHYRVKAMNQFGSSAYSNIAQAKTNFRPVGEGYSLETFEDVAEFQINGLSEHFTDPDPDATIDNIRIGSLPEKGVLKLNGIPVVVDQRIPATDFTQITFTPHKDLNGPTLIELFYNDGKDDAASFVTITIFLTPVNDSPVFSLAETLEVDEDFSQYVLAPVVTAVPFDENSEIVEYAIDPPSSSFVSIAFDELTGTITLNSIQDLAGEIALTVTADDGKMENNTFSQTVMLRINPVNDPPVISVVENQVVNLPEEFAPQLFTINDVDDPLSILSVSATSGNESVVKNNNISIMGDADSQSRTVSISSVDNPGTTVIMLTVTDGKSSAASTFVLKASGVTGMEAVIKDKLTVSPNPTSGMVTISVDESQSLPCTVIIHNIIGSKIFETILRERQSIIDLSAIGSGVYILTPKEGTAQPVIKILKR